MKHSSRAGGNFNSLHKVSGHRWRWIIAICLLWVLAVGGCNRTPRSSEPSAPNAASTAQPLQVPSATEFAESPAEPQRRELVLWTPEFFDPDGEGEANALLATTYANFEEMHSDVRLEVQTKAEFGSASLYNYIRSASQVAPSILPDIVLIDTQQMWQVADLGLLTPFPPEERVGGADMYPFALDAVAYNGLTYGVPYAADVTHLAYRQRITTPEEFSPPTTWVELLALDEPYIFPAGGRSGLSNNALLLQYVSAGGQLTEDGEISNAEALTEVFTFFETGVRQGVIPQGVTEYSSLSAVWVVFANAEVGFANVSAHRYLSERESGSQLQFSPIPTRFGSLMTIGRVWAFAILTQDPEQHALAVTFIEHLLEPTTQGNWSQQAHWLPTRQSAMAVWQDGQAYHAFLQRLLDVAVAVPNGAAFADLSARLHVAQLAVLNGEMTPQEAVASVRDGP